MGESWKLNSQRLEESIRKDEYPPCGEGYYSTDGKARDNSSSYPDQGVPCMGDSTDYAGRVPNAKSSVAKVSVGRHGLGRAGHPHWTMGA